MSATEFDFNDFVASLKDAMAEEQAGRVKEELGRMAQMIVREPGRRFQKQIYVQRLERLQRFLRGEDVSRELTPSEQQAYWILGALQAGTRAAAVAHDAQVTAAPAPDEQPMAVEPPTGMERRQSRRIFMRTRVRIRRDPGGQVELIDPINVSRGGIGFDSDLRYTLHETVWATMHYQPGTSEMETRALIVRAAPLPDGKNFSYGLKFLPA